MAFWRKTQAPTPELLQILARVESGVAEIWIGASRGGYRGLVQVSAGARTAFPEETITDTGVWEIALTFVRNKEDRALTTRVYTEAVDCVRPVRLVRINAERFQIARTRDLQQ